jgi:hypothetical protein
MKARLFATISVCLLLSACFASNLATYETDLEGRVVSHESIANLPYEQAAIGKRLKYNVGSPLPVIDTPQGKAFALPVQIPDGTKSLYFRSVLSSASALTAHIAYPTFIFLSEGMLEISRLEPDLTARNDMSFDAAYFDGLVKVPGGATNVVALFSPEHFGKKFRYEANIYVGAVSGGTVIGGDNQIDEGIPVGPGGPFRMEFRAEIE